MKKIYLFTFAVILCLFAASCNKDMPFPIDQVKRGVAIDITRIPGTDGALADGVTSGDYKLRLLIPTYQGDYSMMSHAQLLAVLTSGGNTTSQVAIDNITTFPIDLTLNIADVYSKFGKTAPSLGEILNFTVNIVLKDGTVIPGWNSVTKTYNNTVLVAEWQVDGRPFSNRVQYSVICPYSLNPLTGTFVGTFNCRETYSTSVDNYTVTLTYHSGLPATIPAGVDPAKLFGVKMEPISPNIWEPTNEYIYIWINTEDMTLIIPQQSTGDFMAAYGGREVFWMNFRNMSVSTCTNTISFTTDVYMPGYGGWTNWTFVLSR